MRYIRTKDRIIKKEEKEQEYNGLHYFLTYDMNKSDYEYYEEDIIAQADTIEELCDEFIFEDSDGYSLCNLCEQTDINVGSKFDELKYWFNYGKEQQYKIRNCYGAIWTKWGLKYVARMNDKGELELL